jgi:hypothetical protein
VCYSVWRGPGWCDRERFCCSIDRRYLPSGTGAANVTSAYRKYRREKEGPPSSRKTTRQRASKSGRVSDAPITTSAESKTARKSKLKTIRDKFGAASDKPEASPSDSSGTFTPSAASESTN